jgi:SNF2 family DNA or RNA helicase
LTLLNKQLKVQEGRLIHKFDVGFKVDPERIWFQRQPFSKVLNRYIKTFKGYKWHGFQDPPVKKWSIENCPRNVFQLMYAWGENPYDWFERPLEFTDLVYDRPEYAKYGAKFEPQQVDMVARGLTYHYQIWAAEQGLGKSLAAMELMERSGIKHWWFAGPKSALASVEEEFIKWGFDPSIHVNVISYDMVLKAVRYDWGKFDIPKGLICDEFSALKNPSAKRTVAVQTLADAVREKYAMDGYVIGMTGTPTAKDPLEVWSQCEIAWPGFLKEGSYRAFERRYAVVEEREDMAGTVYCPRVGWKDEEIARMPKRYKGLMTVYRKAVWLDLPEKVFKVVKLEPSAKILRVAKSLCAVAPNVITALTWCRALSSGFQYTSTEAGDEECSVCNGTGKYKSENPWAEDDTCPNCAGAGRSPVYERHTRMVKCPKDNALRDILDSQETHGRVVISASFQGSIDRVLKICKQRGWAVCCVDGRGWRAYDNQGGVIKLPKATSKKRGNPLIRFWEENEGKVAFVANPGSARFGLTLTAASVMVFYDNNFSAEHRLQMIDRIHRMSMNLILGATIIDLVHLPIDQMILDTLDANRELELLTLDALEELVTIEDDVDESQDLELEEEQ